MDKLFASNSNMIKALLVLTLVVALLFTFMPTMAQAHVVSTESLAEDASALEHIAHELEHIAEDMEEIHHDMHKVSFALRLTSYALVGIFAVMLINLIVNITKKRE